MSVAECCEKVSHHELEAARAEQERQILQEELWRQQMEFREEHQQNLTEMEELRKFQSSTFDTHVKLIEDQNAIMEFSGRLQELKNEVNCMNDSKDFQDAESVRSGNSHVTPVNQCYSQNIPFLKDCWGLYSYCRAAKKGCPTFGIHLENQETFFFFFFFFSNPQASSSAPYPQGLNPWRKIFEEPLSLCLQRREVKD